MERPSEQQLIAAMLETTEKEAHLLAIQTVDLLQAIQKRKFKQAHDQYPAVLERVDFLGGLLLRAANMESNPNERQKVTPKPN